MTTRAPNDRLIALRLRRSLTQEDVARQVADLIVRTTGKPSGINADYVSRLERGKIVWPNRETRSAFGEMFCATDDELGFYNPKLGRPSVPPVASGGLSADAVVELAERATFGKLEASDLLRTHLNPAQRIRTGDVVDFHAMIDMWERLDHSRGGMSSFRSTVLAQVAQAERALGSASFENDSVRRAWMSAVSRAARLAAFSSFDAREHDIARRAFLLAQQAAAEADDWPARINILCGMARQSIYTGNASNALQLVSLARIGEDQSSATTRAMIGSVRARTFAALGRGEDAVRAVKEAEDAFGHRDAAADPPFLWYYDEAQVSGDTGHALYALAINDETFAQAADQHLSRAVELHHPDDVRARSFSLCKLTALRLKWDSSTASLALVEDAIESVSKIRSGRALDDLITVGQMLPSDDATARDLAKRIAAIVAA